MINEHVIKLRRTPVQQAQRDEFLKAAYAARAWLNDIICNAEKDGWSEVECLLPLVDSIYRKMEDTLPTDRAEPRGK
ncbi:hypothetical protein HX52_01140 [Salmonella enterica]|nr:hypothetical protein [Salmonella enterica]EBL7696607.1 hypothetical protein [Salmonella enterica]EDU6130288.1 hypothetical protein [Salmonella enterica subsp. enterica]EGF4127738.1 hypothetical protein [Salmonella enterica]HAF2160544.1 hypothetical protein [Salmonella enterica]